MWCGWACSPLLLPYSHTGTTINSTKTFAQIIWGWALHARCVPFLFFDFLPAWANIVVLQWRAVLQVNNWVYQGHSYDEASDHAVINGRAMGGTPGPLQVLSATESGKLCYISLRNAHVAVLKVCPKSCRYQVYRQLVSSAGRGSGVRPGIASLRRHCGLLLKSKTQSTPVLYRQSAIKALTFPSSLQTAFTTTLDMC